jgi:hypothetical protein
MQHVDIAGSVIAVIKVQHELEPYPLLFMPVGGVLLVQPLPQLSHLLLSLLTQCLQGTSQFFCRTAAACHTIRSSLLLITASSLVHYVAC